MSQKVFARVAGSLVQVGEVFSYEQTEHVERFSIRLDLIPVDGVLSIELRHEEASHAVLRVRDIFQGSFYAKAGDSVPKIPAIKAYREVTGCGLGEAKAWIENHAPTEQKGLGAWGRPAWDYALSPELVSSLKERALLKPLRACTSETEGVFPAWEVIFS
jgi:hypothetical protein